MMQSLLRSPFFVTFAFVVIYFLIVGASPALLALPVFAPILFLGMMFVNWILDHA